MLTHVVEGEERVGAGVWYSPAHHVKGSEDEHGFVTSWNSSFVFVRADGAQHSKACRREDLYWDDAAEKALEDR